MAKDFFKITLYEHINYGGKSAELTSECEFIGSFGFNDIVSSIKVESGNWIVFEHANFQGKSYHLTPGNYPQWQNWGGTNDSMSSVRPREAITLYEHVNFQGRAVKLNTACEFLGNFGFNDTVSSIKVHSGNWTVFEHANYAGRSSSMKPGSYPNWQAWGGSNDNMSSIKLSPSITLYEHANFQGRTVELDGECDFIGKHGFNDIVSSIVVHSGNWTVFEHANYAGRSYNLKPGRYSTWETWGGTNDTMSSVKPTATTGKKITLYEHGNFQGKTVELDGECDFLGKHGFNDVVSSIVVHSGNWTVFEHANYAGRSYNLKPGRYSTWDAWGGTNDSMSSVKPTASITLYEHANFQGRKLELDGECDFIGKQGFNDIVSSIVVHSGNWTVFEHANYAGRSCTLKPGSYSTWEAWGGTNDSMSSVKPI